MTMTLGREPGAGMAARVPGRSTQRHSVELSRGVLSWNCVKQKNRSGKLIFQCATEFQLNGQPLADRIGERLLDINRLRVDNSQAPR